MDSNSPDSFILITSPNKSSDTHLNLNAFSSSKPRKKYQTSQTKLLFTSPTSAAKYESMKHRILAGSNVNTSTFSVVVQNLKRARLYSLAMPEHNVIYQNMLGEFYGNFKTEKGLLGNTFFTTCVKGRHLLVDEFTISRVLKLPAKQMRLFKSENEKNVAFDKDEFVKYLKVMCFCDIPDLVINENAMVNSDYFSITGQFLAQVFCENITPKFPQDKMFNFFELKCMHDILTDNSCSNISNFVLHQLLKANSLGYMAYGLFLTELFDFFGISLSGQPHTHVTHCISTETVNMAKALTQDALGYPKQVLPESHTLADVMAMLKDMMEEIARLTSDGANHIEAQSFMFSALESIARRMDRIEELMGIYSQQQSYQIQGNTTEVLVLYPFGSFFTPVVEGTPLTMPTAGPMMVNTFEGINELYRRAEIENSYIVTNNYYLQNFLQPIPPFFNPIYTDQHMSEAGERGNGNH